MIKINKPAEAPDILKARGKALRAALCRQYLRNKSKYDSGTKSFDFNRDVYGDSTVKKVLKNVQHDKCCFCESKITHVAYGDVEHYRPKAGYRQNKKEELGRPGYYWLAYDWNNVYLACEMCNRRWKANLFPLKDDTKRARCHKDDIEAEEPLFVNPGIENPEEFIGFREEVAYSVSNSDKGKHTIEGLQLNRMELVERRKDKYDLLKALHDIMALTPALPESRKAQVLLNKAIADDAEYAAMIRCAINNNFVVNLNV
jgi:uncharacterized protein (TIGR02646 family)